jgi:hypothetical protein
MTQASSFYSQPIPRILVTLALVLFMSAASASVYAAPLFGEKNPIVPCGIKSLGQPECNLCYIGTTIMNLTDFLIYYIALPATALLIAAGGIILLIAGPSEGLNTLGKNILTSTIIGIIIVLMAWIIVDTIIKVLTNKDFDLSGSPGQLHSKWGPWNKLDPTKCPLSAATVSIATPPPPTPPPPVPPPPPPAAGQCTGCVTLDSTLPVKSTACLHPPDQCQINSEVAGELKTLDQKLKGDKVSWEITEAYPPTIQHKDACHAAGTCIDASLRGSSAGQVTAINTFIKDASTSGLRAVYEVTDPARRDQLVASGVPSASIQVVPGINGEHFSVYNT